MKNLDCFLNGKWLKLGDASVNILTHTFHYGTGVFEGVRSYDGHIFKLEEHTKRLLRSAKLVHFEVPYTEDELNAWQREVIRRNGLQDAYIRPLIYLGEGTMSMDIYHHPVNILIAAWPWTAIHADKEATGLRLHTVSIHKLATNSTRIKAKAVAHYLNSALALNEAKAHGADEALVLDQNGYICEASAQNLFFVKEGQLFTPALGTALDGITRATVMALAKAKGISTMEGDFSLTDLRHADEIFLTGTASEVVGVKVLDGQEVGSGHYPITKMLHKAYLECVRKP